MKSHYVPIAGYVSSMCWTYQLAKSGGTEVWWVSKGIKFLRESLANFMN